MNDRYNDFVFPESPQTFRDMFIDMNIFSVQVYTSDAGFSGKFMWMKNEVIPLDGDSYNADMKVIGYKWFRNSNGQRGINVLVGDDW